MDRSLDDMQGGISTLIDELVELNELEQSDVDQLRRRYPNLQLTTCLQDELGIRKPYIEFEKADIHLIASAPNRCSHLTFEVEAATGLLIALPE